MQIISLDVFGRASGLVHKKGGVNLTKLGGVQEVKRVSDIKWIPEESLWAVRLLCTENSGEVLTEVLFSSVGVEEHGALKVTKEGVLLFEEYDQAVECEVKYFQGLDIKRRET